MDGINKLTVAIEVVEKEKEKMAIVEVQGPGIWMQECCYAPKPEWWTPPNVWEKMVVLEASPSKTGTSDLFWNLTWFPCDSNEELAELELTVRALYPQFPPDVYEIHRMGAP